MIVPFSGAVFADALTNTRFLLYEYAVQDEITALSGDAAKVMRTLRRITGNPQLSCNLQIGLDWQQYTRNVMDVMGEVPPDRRNRVARLIMKLDKITHALYLRNHLNNYVGLPERHPDIPYVSSLWRSSGRLSDGDQFFLRLY